MQSIDKITVPERMFIADVSPEGSSWHKAFEARPEFHTHHYHEYIRADLVSSAIDLDKVRRETLTRVPDRVWEAFQEAYDDEIDLRSREGSEAMYRALLVAINADRCARATAKGGQTDG